MKIARTKRGPSRDQAGTKLGPNKPVGTKPSPPPPWSSVVDEASKRAGYEVQSQIRNILADPDAPATAKVTALRTLAEIEGLIGRHQTAPTHGDTSPLHGLSRDELVTELERLREAVNLGLVK